MVGHWLNNGNEWYVGPPDANDRGAISVVDEDGALSKWTYRIVSEQMRGEVIKLLIKRSDDETMEETWTVAADGATVERAVVISGGGISMPMRTTFTYKDGKRRP